MEKNGQTRRAKLIRDGHKLNVDVRHDEHGIHINVLGGHNDPRLVGKLPPDVLLAAGSIQLQDRVAFSSNAFRILM
jgi:hypothetical protein